MVQASLLLGLNLSCRGGAQGAPEASSGAVPVARASAAVQAGAPAQSLSVMGGPRTPSVRPSASALAAPAAPIAIQVDEPIDLGRGYAARATPTGALLVERDGTTVWRALTAPQGPSAKAPAPALVPFNVPAERVARIPYAAAVLGGKAYFSLGGRLVRRGLEHGSPLETLVDGEGVAGSVVAPVGAAPPRAIVAYLGRLKDRMVARLWVEDVGSRDLSPEGAAATSMALIGRGSELRALSIEGRSGMTPLHSRSIVIAGNQLRLGEDEVVWVGGPAERFTELVGLDTPDGDVALLPIERSVTEFGLAKVGVSPSTKEQVTWTVYPNGIDPAPVAGASICGAPTVVFAHPVGAKPKSPQVLSLARVSADGVGAPVEVASAGSFHQVSIAPLEQGALVVYGADGHVWGLTLRCGASGKASRVR